MADNWNGLVWHVQPTPSVPGVASLMGVSCPDNNFCEAAGFFDPSNLDNRQTILLHWDGSSWATQPLGPTELAGGLRAVSCATVQACLAVGNAANHVAGTDGEAFGYEPNLPTADSWNGTDWSAQPVADPDGHSNAAYSGVSCVTTGGCEAVGDFTNSSGVPQGRAAGWDGTTWSEQLMPDNGLDGTTTPRLSGISCAAAAWCVAVGDDFMRSQGLGTLPLIEVWNGATWSRQSADAGPYGDGALRGVACTSAVSCEAVGYDDGEQRPMAETWNGATWTYQPVPIPVGAKLSYLESVSCTTPASCTAVGYYNDYRMIHAFAAVYAGGTWTDQSVTEPSGATGTVLSGVSCTAVSCEAVGSYRDASGAQHPLAEALGLASSTVQSTVSLSTGTGADLSGVSCPVVSNCEAVGSATDASGVTRPLVAMWDGAAWTAQIAVDPTGGGHSGQAELTAVACVAPGSCTAAGDYTDPTGSENPMIERLAGAAWTEQDTLGPTQAVWSSLDAVTCLAAEDCTGVGTYTDRPGTSAGLVDTIQNNNQVGSEYPGLAGGVPAGPIAKLNAISCASPQLCMRVGEMTQDTGNTALVIDQEGGQPGATTGPYVPPGTIGEGLYGVSCPADNNCVAVGYLRYTAGTVAAMAVTWDGSAWTTQVPPVPAGAVSSKLTSVACPAPGACEAVGYYLDASGQRFGLAEAQDGAAWMEQPAPTVILPGSSLSSVACADATDCEAVGQVADPGGLSQPLAERWDGTSWLAQPVAPIVGAAAFTGVSCPSDLDCEAIGYQQPPGASQSPLAEAWNGLAWQSQTLPLVPDDLTASLAGISCASADSCTAVGSEVTAAGITTVLTLLFAPPTIPSVNVVSPHAGPVSGGNTVTVEGYGFTASTVVSFGSQPASAVSCQSDISCTATVPPGSPGRVDVTVTTSAGTSATSPADEYTYDPVPAVTAVAPDAGPTAGRTLVSILGSGFTGDATVSFGPVPALSVVCLSSAACTAVVPPQSAGTVDVTVTTPGGTSPQTPLDRYTYFAVPAISAIGPSAGPATGGKWVFIAGSGLANGEAVDFGSVPARNVICSSPSFCGALSPPGRGTVDLVVATPGGSSARTIADRYTYDPTPGVTSVSPAVGPLAGGSVVTIRGSGFLPGTAVSFGSRTASRVSCPSTTLCTAVSPSESSGTVDVHVTTPGGTNPSVAADRFTFAAPTGKGYILFGADGGAFAFGDARFYGSVADRSLGSAIAAVTTSPTGHGYWMVTAEGNVFHFGDARYYGSLAPTSAQRVVAMASTPTGNGYWLATSTGRVYAFGDAHSYGSVARTPARPVVAMAATAAGDGYWLTTSDGEVFSFGRAAFHGSAGNYRLLKPIVTMTATPTGHGYWLVASDGGVFAFGDAKFFGSTGGIHLTQPIATMAVAPSGDGYWLFASDGGVFAFGGARYCGSTANLRLAAPIIGAAL